MGRGGAEPPTFHFSGVRQGGHEGARAAVSRSGNTLGTSANRAGGKGIDTTTETTNVRTERLCRLARAGASACPPLEGEYSVCHCSSLSSRQGRRAQSDTSSSRSVGRGRGQGDTRPLTTRDWTETGSSHVARLDSGQGRFGHIGSACQTPGPTTLRYLVRAQLGHSRLRIAKRRSSVHSPFDHVLSTRCPSWRIPTASSILAEGALRASHEAVTRCLPR